jgi:hypothetical protein
VRSRPQRGRDRDRRSHAATPASAGKSASSACSGRPPARLSARAGAAAFVVANLLVLWSGWDTDWRLGVAIAIGYAILAVTRLFGLNSQSPQLDLKAASWLPVYLLGMGAIVYVSDFGPLASPIFPLWWDMVAMAIFSAVIYFWELAVPLPAERIEQMVGDVVLPEERDIADANSRDLTGPPGRWCGAGRAAPPPARPRTARRR